MAAAHLPVAMWAGDFEIAYDTTTKLASAVVYRNHSAYPAAISLLRNGVLLFDADSPAGCTRIVDPFATSSFDITPLGLSLVVIPAVLPPGWAVSVRCPA